MPFIAQERRAIIDERGLAGLADIEPGDRCYVHYKKMVDAWNAASRWSTVHRITRDMFISNDKATEDDTTAMLLAWEVFLHTHVMPYEEQKRKENGDV